jgi:hypothetical protein
VEAIMVRVEKKRAVLNSKPKAPAHTRESSQIDQLAYMCFANPNVDVLMPSLNMNQEEFAKQTDHLWGQMQTGNVSLPVYCERTDGWIRLIHPVADFSLPSFLPSFLPSLISGKP